MARETNLAGTRALALPHVVAATGGASNNVLESWAQAWIERLRSDASPAAHPGRKSLLFREKRRRLANGISGLDI